MEGNWAQVTMPFDTWIVGRSSRVRFPPAGKGVTISRWQGQPQTTPVQDFAVCPEGPARPLSNIPVSLRAPVTSLRTPYLNIHVCALSNLPGLLPSHLLLSLPLPLGLHPLCPRTPITALSLASSLLSLQGTPLASRALQSTVTRAWSSLLCQPPWASAFQDIRAE